MLALLAAIVVAAPPAVLSGPLAPQAVGVPDPDALPEGVAPVAVTPELLERWGIPAERYRALAEPERRRLQVRLTLGERRRLSRLERLRELAPADWRDYVTPLGWITPEGLALLEARERHLQAAALAVPAEVSVERKDGKPLDSSDLAKLRLMLDRVFDGTAALPEPQAGSTWVWDAQFRNETLHRLSASNPALGLTVEVGQLGASGPTGLIAPSWYGNLIKRAESDPGSWVDYRVRAQIGVVDLRARFFDDGPDPDIERAIELARGLGASEKHAAALRENLRYDDAHRARAIVVGSLMAELGRAYHLFGPVDLAWTIGSLTRIAHLAPNQAFDESAGFRIALGERTWLGVFAGATQNLSPVGSRILHDSFAGDLSPGLNLEVAPHATIALWGEWPELSGIRYQLKVRQQWGRELTATEVEGAVATTLLEHPLALRGSWRKELGYGGEYDRERLRGALELDLSPQARAWVGVEKERFRYGNAEMDWEAALVGLEIVPGRGTRISADHVFGASEFSHVDRSALESVTRGLNRLAVEGLAAADGAAALWDSLRRGVNAPAVELSVNELSRALARLGPDARARVLAELDRLPLSAGAREAAGRVVLRTMGPSHMDYEETLRRLSGFLDAGAAAAQRALRAGDEASRWFREHRAELAELASILSRAEFWESVLVSAGRSALLEEIRKVELPLIWGAKLTVDAPVVLAGAMILQARPSAIAPVGKGQLDPLLLEQAGSSLGLGRTATPEALLAALFDRGQNELERALSARLEPLLSRIPNGSAPDAAALRGALLSNLPQAVRDSLTRRYGADLSGLLPPPGASAEAWRAFLSGRLAAELRRVLEREAGPALAAALGEAVSWAGELVRREVNMTVLRMIVASEQLNRLTVDGGAPLADHSVRMMLSSFDMLDRRGRLEAGRRLNGAKALLTERLREEDESLALRLKDYGASRLASLQLEPSWPRRLRVEVNERDWPAILSYYGDAAFFELAERLRARAVGLARDLTVTFDFDGIGGLGTMIRLGKDGTARVSLPRARDAAQARLILAGLDEDLLAGGRSASQH